MLLVTSYRVGGRNLLDVVVLFERQLPSQNGTGLADGATVYFTQTLTLGGAGATAPSVVVADLNGDGWPDLVVAADAQPVVLLNRFAADVGYTSSTLDKWRTPFEAVPVTNPAEPWTRVGGLLVGDFSGTGRADVLVEARTARDTRLVTLGRDGAGRLSTQTFQQVPGAGGPLATADFDRNSLPDVAILDPANEQVLVGLNAGGGQFRAADLSGRFGSYPLPPMTGRTLAAADLNGDGWADLLVTGTAESGRPLVVALLNDAGGGFRPWVELTAAAPPGGTGQAVVSDLNRDGLPDLVFPGPAAGPAGWVGLNTAPHGTGQLLELASGASVVAEVGSRGSGGLAGGVPADIRYGYLNSRGVLIRETVSPADLTAYLDENRNGRYDYGERTAALARTAAGNRYEFRFDGLGAGTYAAGLLLRGWGDYFANTLKLATATSFTQEPLVVTLGEGQAVAGLEFARAGGRVTGEVFDDQNRNGRRDAGESGVAGAQVFDDQNRNGLLDAGEAVLCVTGPDGRYELTATAATTWRLSVAPPAGYALLSQGFGLPAYSVNGRTVSGFTGWPRPVYLDGGVRAEAIGLPVVAVSAPTASLAGVGVTFDEGYAGPVTAILADLTGDRTPDLVAAAGAGGGPRVRVWDGATGQLTWDFLAFEESFRGGVDVAVADVTGDGVPDLIVGAGAGGGPRVRVYDGATREVVADFFAFEESFRGGVDVAAGDLDGDGRAEVIVGAGAGGGPRVRVYGTATWEVVSDQFVFEETFRGGVSLDAGDLDGDGRAELAVGAGAGGGPRVRVLGGLDLADRGGAMVFDPSNRTGVRVQVAALAGADQAAVLATPMTDGAETVVAYRPSSDSARPIQTGGPFGPLADAADGPAVARPWAAYVDHAAGSTRVRLVELEDNLLAPIVVG